MTMSAEEEQKNLLDANNISVSDLNDNSKTFIEQSFGKKFNQMQKLDFNFSSAELTEENENY